MYLQADLKGQLWLGEVADLLQVWEYLLTWVF